jgi:acyl carrier protein
MINRGGEVIAPKEIEDTLLDHPAVREAAAFAVPNERLGENVAVAVVLRADHTLEASAVRDFVAARLSPSKVPGPVMFLDELPKGGTGKVLRRELMRVAVQHSAEADAVSGGGPESPVEELVAELWREYFGVEAVARDANFFEFGGDSLLAARFAGRINSMLAIVLPIHRLLLAPTVAGIAAEIEELIVNDEHAA